MMGPKGISRRQILSIAAGATGASIAGTAAVIGTSTVAHAAKVPQKAVKVSGHAEGRATLRQVRPV